MDLSYQNKTAIMILKVKKETTLCFFSIFTGHTNVYG